MTIIEFGENPGETITLEMAVRNISGNDDTLWEKPHASEEEILSNTYSGGWSIGLNTHPDVRNVYDNTVTWGEVTLSIAHSVFQVPVQGEGTYHENLYDIRDTQKTLRPDERNIQYYRDGELIESTVFSGDPLDLSSLMTFTYPSLIPFGEGPMAYPDSTFSVVYRYSFENGEGEDAYHLEDYERFEKEVEKITAPSIFIKGSYFIEFDE